MQENQIKIAAAEILTDIARQTRPANEILNAYTRSRRYIGSKDRRRLADLVWGVLRTQARLTYILPKGSWLDKIDLYLTGDYDRAEAPDWVQWEVPEWLIKHVESPEREFPALLNQADTVLRANGPRAQIAAALQAQGIETRPTSLSPFGLILQKRCNLNESRAYKTGQIEVQDEGSQLVALKTGIKPGDMVLDYCAGAGGKSLIFAQMMQNRGKIVAHDISARSLNELVKRAQRAGVTLIETKTSLKPDDFPSGFDHVVVDAPCSGTGTWRRCPDARWKLTPLILADLVHRQAGILNTAADFVAPKGRLSYMTCSLTKDENMDQAAAFLTRHPDFKLIEHHQFSPARTRTDGLFVAVMQKN